VGLFKFVGKALGTVAKMGLSVATKGLSDKVFSALKSSGQAKQAAKMIAAQQVTNQRLAQAVKIEPRVAPEATIARAVKTKGAILKGFPGGSDAPKRRRRKKKAAGTTAKRAKATTGAKRKPPKGGLDFRAMAVQWRAHDKMYDGRKVSWLEWQKIAPIKNK